MTSSLKTSSSLSSLSGLLNDIDNKLGKEIFNISENGRKHIQFSILSSIDLIDFLCNSLIFDIWIPIHSSSTWNDIEIAIRANLYNSNHINVKQCLDKYISSRSIDFIYFHIPWLRSSQPNLLIIFYTLRNLLKRKDIPSWFPSIVIANNILQSISNNELEYHQKEKIILYSGTGRVKGKRPYMEDRDFAFPNINIAYDKTYSLYGIFDGHGGSECAQFIADELASKVTLSLRSINPNAMPTNPSSLPDILCNCFNAIDESYLKATRNNSGSTANVILSDLNRSVIYVANTGDTRSVLCRNGVAVDLSYDRKATDCEEIARIISNEGEVTNGRVQGILAISRAFGDKHLKEKANILIANPEIICIDIFPHIDQFIVMATDGLWDVLSNQSVVDMVKESLSKANISFQDMNLATKLNQISEAIASHAVKIGSMDNVTVTILLIRGTSNKIATTDRNQSLQTLEYILKTSPINIDKPQLNKVDSSLNISSTVIIEQENRMNDKSNNVSSINQTCEKSSTESNVKVNQLDDMMDFLLDDSNF